jgi:hypothetical protein
MSLGIIKMSPLWGFKSINCFFYYDVAPPGLYILQLFFLLRCRPAGALYPRAFFLLGYRLACALHPTPVCSIKITPRRGLLLYISSNNDFLYSRKEIPKAPAGRHLNRNTSEKCIKPQRGDMLIAPANIFKVAMNSFC